MPTRAQVKQNINDISINNIIRNAFGVRSNASAANESNALVNVPLNIMNAISTAQPITPDPSSSLINLTVDLLGAEVKGLDTFYVFNLLQPTGDFTILTDLGLEQLSVRLDMEMDFAVSPQDASTLRTDKNAANVSDAFSVTFGASNVSLSTGLLAAIDDNVLMNMQLGALYNNPVACGISSVLRIALTHFTLVIEDLDTPGAVGLFNPHLDNTLTKLIDVIFEMFQVPVLKAMPHLSDTFVRQLFADSMASFIEKSTAESCPLFPPPTLPPQYIDFQTNSLFLAIKGIADSMLVADAFDGRPTINVEYIDYYTEQQSGVEGELWFLKESFDMETQVPGIFDRVGFRVGNIKVKGIEINALRLLDPVQKHVLLTSFMMGEEKPLSASVDFYLILSKGDRVVENDFTLTISLNKIFFLLEVLARVDSEKIGFMPLREITSLSCWAHLVDEFSIEKLLLTIDAVVANIDCHKCTSIGLIELSQNLRKRNASYFSTEQTNRDLKKVADYLAGDDFGNYMNGMLREARKACNASYPTPPPTSAPTTVEEYTELLAKETTEKIMKSLAGISGVVAVLIAVGVFVAVRKRRRDRRTYEYKEWKRTVDECRKELSQSTVSMYRSEVVPRMMRFLIPLCLCINIGLFISAHLSLGATVDIIVTFAGERVEILNYVEFSIAKSVIDAFTAGAYMLGIIILCFSGLWPYIKMFTMLYVWFAGTCRLNPVTRGNILRWMDVLGKWSMIDNFVLVLTVVAFRINILSPDTIVVLPRDFYVVDLVVVPVWGLYANLLAQLLSQVVSHFAIHYHRNIIANAGYHYLNIGKSKSATPKDVEMTSMKENVHGRTQRYASTSWLAHGTTMEDKGDRGRGRSMAALSWLSHGTDNVPADKAAGVYHKEALCAHVFDRTKRERLQMRFGFEDSFFVATCRYIPPLLWLRLKILQHFRRRHRRHHHGLWQSRQQSARVLRV